MKRAIGSVLAATVWLACSAKGGDAPPLGCNAGDAHPCTCDDGRAGTATCNASGAFDACACAAFADGGVSAAPSCGDGKCNGEESCRTCARDCGECPKCSLAPSCTDAVGVPSAPTVRGDLCQPAVTSDAGAADAGAPDPTCLDPKLRFRISKIVAHSGGGQIYCVVSANDGASSEAAITQKTKSLGDGEADYFDPSTAIYWGQKDLHPTTNNLAVTIDCFLVKGDEWAKVLKAMGDSATSLGGTPTPYGWAFGVGGVAANAAAAAIEAGSGDDHRFNAQQILDKKDLLDLTNGRTWSFRQSGGCGLFCNWDWEIFVESWGCADAQTVTH